MGKIVLLGALGIGLSLIIGEVFYTDNIIMWFAANTTAAEIWRPAIVIGLCLAALIEPYYDSVYLRLVWTVTAAGVLGAGVLYFIDNPQYVFDALYFLVAGICFTLAAIRRADDPLPVPLFIRWVHAFHVPRVRLTYPAWAPRWRPRLHLPEALRLVLINSKLASRRFIAYNRYRWPKTLPVPAFHSPLALPNRLDQLIANQAKEYYRRIRQPAGTYYRSLNRPHNRIANWRFTTDSKDAARHRLTIPTPFAH